MTRGKTKEFKGKDNNEVVDDLKQVLSEEDIVNKVIENPKLAPN